MENDKVLKEAICSLISSYELLASYAFSDRYLMDTNKLRQKIRENMTHLQHVRDMLNDDSESIDTKFFQDRFTSLLNFPKD